MSRVGKNPVADPRRSHHRPQGPGISRSRASAASSRSSCMTTSRSPRTATSSTSSRAATAAARACSGAPRATSRATWFAASSDGFTVNLEINGVGYRAQADAKKLKLQLGFSHDVEVPIPAGIQIKAVEADRDRDHRRGSSEGRTARRGDPQPASARALQGQGHQVLDRDDPRARKARRSKAIHHVRQQSSFRPPPAARALSRCARPPATVRASASSARASTSTPRSSTTVRA